ncbi:XisI protein [Bacillus cereus group sp. BfR-BA-01323]|uniref:XisI protein n=1 Tax=Bacillus cereus group sp. BfR-BA-01323 TaxID=2920299 RepID=UPI001F568241
MAFLQCFKSQGKRYFYLTRYTGKQTDTRSQYERFYSFGNENVALERLSLWTLDTSFIPNELVKLGISREDIVKWKEKVLQVKQTAS